MMSKYCQNYRSPSSERRNTQKKEEVFPLPIGTGKHKRIFKILVKKFKVVSVNNLNVT